MKRNWMIAVLVGGLITAGVVRAEDEKEGKEEKVAVATLPAAVKDTLTKESFGATLPENVDKQAEDGKTLYEADVKIDGKNYEIKIAEDGSLLSKKLDQEDEKKGEEKEEKEKK
jgi:hypothetical protein